VVKRAAEGTVNFVICVAGVNGSRKLTPDGNGGFQ
jgi:hypothetical protein